MKFKTKCLRCQFGAVNFWSYVECWKFNKSIDEDYTTNTAIRERHKKIYNSEGACPHYSAATWFIKLGDLAIKLFSNIF